MLLILHIQLARISKAPVWRQITVPGRFTFHKLRKIIQAAFAWEKFHLYQFSEKGYHSDVITSVPSNEHRQKVQDSRKIKLLSVFTDSGERLVYSYDFADDSLNNITAEKIAKVKAIHAELTAWKGMCPLEDCGGFFGYERLKEIMKNLKDPEYEETKVWLGTNAGEGYNSRIFDLEGRADG